MPHLISVGGRQPRLLRFARLGEWESATRNSKDV